MSEASSELTLPQDEGASAPNAEAPLSPLRTLTGVLIHPRATFEKLRDAQRGYWWVVFVLAVVAALVLALASTAAQRSTIQAFVASEGTTTDGVAVPANMAQTATTLMIVGGTVSGILSALFGYLLLTLIVFGAGLILGGKATFRQVFTMSVWTTLPYVVRSLVQAIASLVTGASPAPGLSGVLSIAETASMPLLNAILSRIDVYMVWSLVLLTIGVGVVYRLSKGKKLLIVAIYVVVTLVLIVASTALGSAIGNILPGGGASGGGGGGGGGGPRVAGGRRG
jgi:hypothetical protein